MNSVIPKWRITALAICGAFLVIMVGLYCIAKSGEENSFVRPRIEELAATSLDGRSPYDKKASLLEGFWYGPNDGFAITSSTAESSATVLVRPGPDAFPEYKASLLSHLPHWMTPDPIGVSHGDRVRAYGVYYARGWQPSGYLLHDCGWFEISRVEIWDSRSRSWKHATTFWP